MKLSRRCRMGRSPCHWLSFEELGPRWVLSVAFLDSGQTLGELNTAVVALGDFDTDGDLDAYFGNRGQPDDIWLNDGRGNFTDSGQRNDQWDTTSVALGDLDGDGDLDVLAGIVFGASKVVLNDGQGNFDDSGQSLPQAYAVALGDLDNDGDLDAFLGDFGRPNAMWLNNGQGVFIDSGQSLGQGKTGAVALGDLDGDGDWDAFVGNLDEPNRAWLNDGLGNFTDSGQTLGQAQTRAVALGDVDGDGDLDAFVGNSKDPFAFESEPNEIWLNDGRGNFTDSGQRLSDERTLAVALGDVDLDGDLDDFVANDERFPNRIWLNNGRGTFTEGRQALGNSSSAAVWLGDVDGDGDLDALVGNVNTDGLANPANKLWVNDVFGSFTDSGQILGEADTFGVALGDLDGDGDLDALVGNFAKPNELWLNDGNANFTDSGQQLALQGTGIVALGDVDGDGDFDALVGSFAERNEVEVWHNDGRGDLTDSGHRMGRQGTTSIALGDVNGDGHVDALVGRGDRDEVSYLWLNDGGGNFARGQSFRLTDTRSVNLGDVDGDGDLDAVLGNHGCCMGGQPNDVWLNDGSGNLIDSRQMLRIRDNRLSSWTTAVELADLDGDGDLDAFVGNARGQPNEVWLNDGTGNFTENGQRLGVDPRDPRRMIAEDTRAVALADLNGDGDLDAIVGNFRGPNTVWLNNGRGNFTDGNQPLGEADTEDIAVGDLDGDGDLDVFLANRGSNQVWLNQSAVPVFAPKDANRDFVFDQLDIVQVLQAAKYLTGEPAEWSEGDWNEDGVFNQFDIIAALQTDNYLRATGRPQ